MTAFIVWLAVFLAATAVLLFVLLRRKCPLPGRQLAAWLTDARLYIGDVLRGRGRGTGLHVLPAGEAPERPAWLPLIDPPGSENWTPDQWMAYDLGLEPLPVQVGNYNDPLREHIDAAWAATGVTQAQFWAQQAPDRVDEMVAEFHASARPEPTPNQRQLLWAPHEVLHPHVVAVLEHARPDETAIDDRLSPADHATWLEHAVGGDPWDGCGSPEAWVEKLFYGLRVPA